MKIGIVYHSESGNTKSIAEAMKEEGNIIPNIEVEAFDVNTINEKFLKDAKVIIFGCPTYCGTLSWQMKKFFDTNTIGLKGKLGCTFATENYIGGGADVAELSIVGCLLVHGMLVYTGGAMDAPATHFGAVVIKNGNEDQIKRAKALIRKVVIKAKEIFE